MEHDTVRTSHVGRLPPPKGSEDMPGWLASAEITDPAVIAAWATGSSGRLAAWPITRRTSPASRRAR